MGHSQADLLVQLAGTADLFHTPDGTGYADLPVRDHRETYPIRSRGFRRWLVHRFYEDTTGAPRADALRAGLAVIEAQAQFDGKEQDVAVRVAGRGGHRYVDLADEPWGVVEIGPDGWRVVEQAPVRFRRASGMEPLPIPKPGGSIATLRSFLNVRCEDDWVLVIAWMLAVLGHSGPYPVLARAGEQGAAKSTFAAILRALLDPNTAPLRSLPRTDHELFIAAHNAHVLCFDNVSGLPGWMSDTLCRLATGGGFAVRQLFTDTDEVLFEATRPVILTGIEDVITRPDLADRAIVLTLDPIRDEARRSEADLWGAFEQARPQILGALLDVVAHGLQALPETPHEDLPRMADFASWAAACETALWRGGTVRRAYERNRDDAIEHIIAADLVGSAVRAFMTMRSEWAGTASDLLAMLGEAGTGGGEGEDGPRRRERSPGDSGERRPACGGSASRLTSRGRVAIAAG